MQKPIKNVEKIFLLRSLLKDGLTQKQANEYIESIGQEIKKNHQIFNKEIIKRKVDFKKEFRKLKKGKK